MDNLRDLLLWRKIKKTITIYWPIFILLLFFSLFYFSYINLTASDLGRHIINGREIIAASSTGIFLESTQNLLQTNYYSFTQGDFEFINHHWLFGVIVFYIHTFSGFVGLTIVNVILAVCALGITLAKTIRKEKFEKKLLNKLLIWLVFLVGFFVLPLLTNRVEVRPESFSLFFFAIYFFVFDSFTQTAFQKKLTKERIISLLPIFLIQIIWVNTHLFFIFGPLIAGYYAFEQLMSQLFNTNSKEKNTFLFWLLLSMGLFLVSLFNPNGVVGLLAPFNIFDNYAYRVAENQSSLFMINYGIDVNYYFFVILISSIALFSFIFRFIQITQFEKKTLIATIFPKIVLLLSFIFLGNKINRMSPFLALIILPIVVENSTPLLKKIQPKIKQITTNSFFLMISSTISFALFILIFTTGIFTPRIARVGVGLLPNIQNSAQFFKKNSLEGPVFNNYDIGGYFIYNFFPEEQTFIDNRPEAYSSLFIKEEYLASLTNESVWENTAKKYDLNTIFFYRHDQMDGAQQFLFNRVSDEKWIPVYIDNFVIIFVKNIEKNQNVINKHQIPNEIFTIGG